MYYKDWTNFFLKTFVIKNVLYNICVITCTIKYIMCDVMTLIHMDEMLNKPDSRTDTI
jgi:hypothetical protein